MEEKRVEEEAEREMELRMQEEYNLAEIEKSRADEERFLLEEERRKFEHDRHQQHLRDEEARLHRE